MTILPPKLGSKKNKLKPSTQRTNYNLRLHYNIYANQKFFLINYYFFLILRILEINFLFNILS